LEAKAKIKKASDGKMTEAREKFLAVRKGKQELVSWNKKLY